jgi:hypothetical protein
MDRAVQKPVLVEIIEKWRLAIMSHGDNGDSATRRHFSI